MLGPFNMPSVLDTESPRQPLLASEQWSGVAEYMGAKEGERSRNLGLFAYAFAAGLNAAGVEINPAEAAMRAGRAAITDIDEAGEFLSGAAFAMEIHEAFSRVDADGNVINNKEVEA